MRCARAGTAPNLVSNATAQPRPVLTAAKGVTTVSKNTNDLTVLSTVSASSRPVAVPVPLFGVVHAGFAVQYQGTGMSIALGDDGRNGDVTPRERFNPSGTTTWSPPV